MWSGMLAVLIWLFGVVVSLVFPVLWFVLYWCFGWGSCCYLVLVVCRLVRCGVAWLC